MIAGSKFETLRQPLPANTHEKEQLISLITANNTRNYHRSLVKFICDVPIPTKLLSHPKQIN